jgi:hypothetical protein
VTVAPDPNSKANTSTSLSANRPNLYVSRAAACIRRWQIGRQRVLEQRMHLCLDAYRTTLGPSTRARGGELPLNEIRRAPSERIGVGGPPRLAARLGALNAVLVHQPCNPVATDELARSKQRLVILPLLWRLTSCVLDVTGPRRPGRPQNACVGLSPEFVEVPMVLRVAPPAVDLPCSFFGQLGFNAWAVRSGDPGSCASPARTSTETRRGARRGFRPA